MTPTHDHLLADIERRLLAQGTALEDVDVAIAAELGVPVDYYLAYLLVWGALEARQHRPDVPDGPSLRLLPGHRGKQSQPQPDGITDPQVRDARDALSLIGWHAATLYRACAHGGCDPAAPTEHAARILGQVIVARQQLRALDARLGPNHPAEADQGVRRAR